ncbi:PH domain protein [Aspergillus ruber CBS 135680]|uniref:PH domain-containing protein n=1 Tax=Aspergillus ruber (strain CBS 135680) TaxID=1388766 RepID=A0A017S3F6_ASPRC|nr:uncharacterized protein EURHEDRAFT_380992 [Aspergillus ruber CBS 135680]EYE91487.1 hypothetical protein EURHEDRAFT_380992 [Aspergillus ruber CBS 135680]
MARSRVISFMSSLGPSRNSNQANNRKRDSSASFTLESSSLSTVGTTSSDAPSPVVEGSPTGAPYRERRGSRPSSAVFSHKPPQLDVSGDTPAEIQPIFALLNSHANKIYQEGYFLKLNDLDTHGRPCPDRQWVECYAQLIGTVLSLWNAAALDAARDGQEVPPTFINLADASIKTIETLPVKNQQSQPLKNVLSLCSAGQNRYLLHFNSFNSLVQWTSAIRLAMYEHTSLYEAYTGSIFAGKGKGLANASSILQQTRFKHEDWARVRFGAGTPWRRCWFVVSPPDEKEIQKARKTMKRRSAYDRSPSTVKGNIKFYESKKTKKQKPIATVTNAYAAYAIYPESIPLIDQSTLVKIEGHITIHASSESSTEGFVFVMPETHPAVSGFETMLRFLIPTFDTFNLYGRPNRIIAVTNHIKSIMFAFPRNRRHGYLDSLDIANLMQTPGCLNWSETEWRQQLKEATARRMAAGGGGSRSSSISSEKPRFRASLPNRQSTMPVGAARMFTPPSHFQPALNQSVDNIIPERPREEPESPSNHSRAQSDTVGLHGPLERPSRFRTDMSPASSVYHLAEDGSERPESSNNDRSISDHGQQVDPQAAAVREDLVSPSPPAPVSSPPAFTHGPNQTPSIRPRPSVDARKANNRMSKATFAQMAAASGAGLSAGSPTTKSTEDMRQQNVSASNPYASEPRGLGVSDVNWHASSEVIAAPKLVTVPSPITIRSAGSTPSSGSPSAPSSIKNRLSLDTTKAIKRKPVGQSQRAQFDVTSPVVSTTGEPSYDDLRHTVDEDALNQVGLLHDPTPSPAKDSHHDEESVYDTVYDDASTVSPDYASTHGSVYSKASSVRRPRMGVKKTVGGGEPERNVVIGDAKYTVDQQQSKSNPDIPSVDFGPTMTYLPTTGRPSTADTLKQSGHERTGSDSTERQRINVPTYSSHSRNSSRDERRRSIPWQPGMSNGRPTTPLAYGQGPTSPVHPRPQKPPVSPNWMAHSTSNMHLGQNQSQPRSRGTGAMMPQNISPNLSAREQEHVARMTGSAFFNMSSSSHRQQPQAGPRGLVAEIDARERQKKDLKEGMSNHMVQHAIAQRQQHMQYQPQHASYYGGDAYNGYNLPAAGHSVGALNQAYRTDEPRRQTWYGNRMQQTAPIYYSQGPGQYTNMH